MTRTEAETKYDEFIASIDNSVAGEDSYGNLAWHVACSAESNAAEMGFNPASAEWFEEAYNTASMAHDAWQDFYPQLIK